MSKDDQPPYDPRVPRDMQGFSKMMDSIVNMMNTQQAIKVELTCSTEEFFQVANLLRNLRAPKVEK